jgi:hypothetical protein
MSLPTLILSPRFTEDSQRLWEAAIQLGWRVERLYGWRVPEHLTRIAEPVLYLEALLAPSIAPAFGLALHEPPEGWLPQLPECYRHRAVQLSTLGAARALLPAFVKPPNDKSFPARVYGPGELPEEFPDDTPVLVQEPVTWVREFRCFVHDRTLRTWSVYLRDGALQREAGFPSTAEEGVEVEEFVTRILADPEVSLPPACALDVGEIWGRGWAVVEVNSAWGAGIYGCDPVAVLHVLRQAAEPRGRG